MDKPAAFIGREALAARPASAATKRLVLLSLDDPAAFPWGGEPILMDGRSVGEITSAGYSRRLGRAVAMGYARSDVPLTDGALLTARYQVDVAGVLFAATPHLRFA
jgi:4-methylaminobutanoate oxidase (formaldehyde-forming)